jgi:hypothetical protein
MTTPTFVGAGSIVSDISGDAVTTPTPPTHQAGDILLAVSLNDNNIEMVTATEGWTRIAEESTVSDRQAWFYKRATGAGTAGPTITASNTDQWAICYAYREALDSGTPYEDITTWSASASPTMLTSEITTTAGDRLVISLLAVGNDIGWVSSPPPAGWTLDDDQTSGAGTDVRFTAISKGEVNATTISQVTIGTFASGHPAASMTMGIIPEVITPPSGTNMQINIGDSWKDVDALKINIGDSWKDVVAVKQNISDSWKDVF